MTNLFHRDFDAELEAEARAAMRERACRYTQEDLDAAVAEALARGHDEGKSQGYTQGLSEAFASLEARQVEALATLGPQLEELLKDRLQHRATLERQLITFVLDVAEKVFPEFLATRSAEAAAVQVRHALGLALGSPRLRLQLSEPTRAALAAELEALVRDRPASQQIDITTDPKLADGEARVIWEDGLMEYSYDRVCSEILRALRQAAGPELRPLWKAI